MCVTYDVEWNGVFFSLFLIKQRMVVEQIYLYVCMSNQVETCRHWIFCRLVIFGPVCKYREMYVVSFFLMYCDLMIYMLSNTVHRTGLTWIYIHAHIRTYVIHTYNIYIHTYAYSINVDISSYQLLMLKLWQECVTEDFNIFAEYVLLLYLQYRYIK